MKISICGLGYVGTVSAGCLAEIGHQIIGVDINQEKVRAINEGKSPIVEKGLDRIIKRMRREGSLSATTNDKEVLKEGDKNFEKFHKGDV